MGKDDRRRVTLDPRKIPGFAPDWRRDISGAWYGQGEIFRPVFKHVDTEQGLSSVQLAWSSEWLEQSSAECVVNRGLHLGLPEAPIECGPPLHLPPSTGIGIAAIVGPETNDWEPTTLEQRAFGRMWARVLKHLHRPDDHELCFVPSWIGAHSEELNSSTPEGIAALLDHLAAEFECQKVADFNAGDYAFDDPQLLPWGYLCCPHEQLEDALAQGGGAGATGFIAPRGRSGQVKNWAKLVSPTVRLDTQLNECLLMFEVLWHGEALAILSRQVDPDDIEEACNADDVTALVRRLKPSKFESEEGLTREDTSPPWMSDGDE